MMKYISPLRYFGGKTRAVGLLEAHSPQYLDEMVSPFGGGNSYEIFTARKGVDVYSYDTYQPLICYWEYQLNDPESLYEAALALYPLDDAEHLSIQKTLHLMGHSVEQAASVFALNYTTYASMGQSAACTRTWDRFNPNMIARILKFDEPNLTVQYGDYRDSIPRHRDAFMYLDPPYCFGSDAKNNKYGNQGSHHRDFDHHALFDLIKDRSNWLMSFNDCVFIRELYADFDIEEIGFRYSLKKDKGRELLIKPYN